LIDVPRQAHHQLKVSDLGDIVSRMPPTVQKSATIGQAIDVMLSGSHSDRIYVIDIEGNLVGLVGKYHEDVGAPTEISRAPKSLHEVIKRS
jgi:CBS domain-containing protein